MTIVGAGGHTLKRWAKSIRFHREYDKLTIELRDTVDRKLQDLSKSPMPPGLAFEKLSGCSKPDIYTIHATGNYKISFEINDGTAFLRRVGTHDE